MYVSESSHTAAPAPIATILVPVPFWFTLVMVADANMFQRLARFFLARLLLLVALAPLVACAWHFYDDLDRRVAVTSLAWSANGKEIVTAIYWWKSLDSGGPFFWSSGSYYDRLERMECAVVDIGNSHVTTCWDERNLDLSTVRLVESIAGESVLFLREPNTIVGWNVSQGLRVSTMGGEESRSRLAQLQGETDIKIALSPNGELLAVGSQALIQLVDARSLKAPTHSVEAGGSAIAFAPNGATIAALDRDGEVALFDVATMMVRTTLPVPPTESNAIKSFSFSQDGLYLAAASQYQSSGVRVWNTPERKEVAFVPTVEEAWTVFFDPTDSGRIFAAGPELGLVSVDLTAKKVVASINADSEIVVASISPDGTLLATGEMGGRVSVRDAKTLQTVRSIAMARTYRIPQLIVLLAASALWILAWRRTSRPGRAGAKPAKQV